MSPTHQATTDVEYAIDALLRAGAAIHAQAPTIHGHDRWIIRTTDQRHLVVSTAALIELAHHEARRRRDHWQHTVDRLEQAQLFDPATTGHL